MDRFFGILGIAFLLGVAYLMSNNRKAIDKRLVATGLLLQLGLAVFVLKTPVGKAIFAKIGEFIRILLDFSNEGAKFVFGALADPSLATRAFGPGNGFMFFSTLTSTIIFVAVLVSILYYLGIMQWIVGQIAKIVYWVMGVSGAEAISNVSSAFVGQVEAQIMIKPYLQGMTMSELLASMTGSMACIAGGVMAVYISMGVPAEFLLAASIMAAPGALVVSKIVWPETEESLTRGKVNVNVEKNATNLIDAISHGCSEGMKISINVIAMLIGFLALIALFDWFVHLVGTQLGHILTFIGLPVQYFGVNLYEINFESVIGLFFAPIAFLMGVPGDEILTVGGLMGTKLTLNEFVAYSKLAPIISADSQNILSPKSIVIASFALCGFANLGSIGIQIGGIGALAPNRRADLAKLAVKALVCGTMASYISAAIAGILLGNTSITP